MCASIVLAFAGCSKKEPPPKPSQRLPRVLIIGDSISIGYYPAVKESLRGVAEVVRPNGNHRSTWEGIEQIDQQLSGGPWTAIHFNWGLHDMAYVDARGVPTSVDLGKQRTSVDQYKRNLEHLVARLNKTGATLIWAASTPVLNGTRAYVGGDAKRYNQAAKRIMQKHAVRIDDLHAFASRRGAGQIPADLHFTEQGYQRLGRQVASAIRPLIDPSRLIVGTHQEHHPAIRYSGSWQEQTSAELHGGASQASKDPEGSIEFDFEGTGVLLHRAVGRAKSDMNVCVDDRCERVSNADDREHPSAPFGITGLTPGVHRLALRLLKPKRSPDAGASFALDAVTIFSEDQALPHGHFEENDPRIRYKGDWRPTRDASSALPSDEWSMTSRDEAATVSFAFEGAAVVLYRSIRDDKGRSKLCVDGECRALDDYSEGRFRRQPALVWATGSSVHRVVWRHETGGVFDLGAIDVLEATKPLPPKLYSLDHPSLHFLGEWSKGDPDTRRTRSARAMLTAQIEGRKALVHVTAARDRGRVQVCLGSTCKTHDLSDATRPSRRWVAIDAPRYGRHVLTVKKDSGRFLELHGLRIAP